jgi:hypothetical protein
MNLPTPIFIGFFPKITQPRPEWIKTATITEICSVSEDISKGPNNWIDQWKHNSLGFFDSEQIAISLISDNLEQYDIYAYEMFPFHVLNSLVSTVEIDFRIGTVPPDYESLGHDIVTKSASDFFECSPLSCNNAAENFTTNKFCLLDGEAKAYDALLEMSKAGSGVEPGPYYLFKVYRKKRAQHRQERQAIHRILQTRKLC